MLCVISLFLFMNNTKRHTLKEFEMKIDGAPDKSPGKSRLPAIGSKPVHFSGNGKKQTLMQEVYTWLGL